MDHHEQHHQHHEKDREWHKKQEKERDQRSEKGDRSIHPAWFIAIGVVLIGLVLLVWTLAF
jgi:hypothetical protein